MHKQIRICIFLFLPLVLCSACARPDQELYRKVIEAVKNGEIKPNHSEITELPPSLKQASVDGKIFLKGTPQQFMVVFKDWIGKGNNFSGSLYTSVPLSASEKESGYISIAAVDVAIEKKIDENWYPVSFRLD